jgi:phosphatidylserine/phosphatidylglycerophosphate/cardiolipin synthase-like enzyme
MLHWNLGSLRLLFRGSMVVDLIRWAFHRSIRVKFDSAYPVGSSQHQKIAVIDDALAVCGGIDMTSDRWDTRAHLHEDPRRRRPNKTLYGPWHDLTMMMEGEVAQALAELARERWKIAGAPPLTPIAPRRESPWPKRLIAEFREVEIGIARTRARYGEVEAIHEIEALFVEQIARARRFVYAETQYFASRRIAEAIAARLSEANPPEFFIVSPLAATGWIEQTAMDTARMRLLHALHEVDHASRFHCFVPYTTGGTPIYVHAKLLIVDDEIVRVGSANMNNRSMGIDTECDVFIDAARPANGHVGPMITRLRHSLLAEHCGIEAEEVEQLLQRHGSMAAMIAALPNVGKRLAPLALRPLTDAEKTIADSALLDPERPSMMFKLFGRRGLFRRGGILRRPK